MFGLRRKSRKSSSGGQWWSDVEEAPRAGLPDARSQERRARRMRWLVWASVVLLPCALLTVVATATTGTDTASSSSPAGEYVDTKPRAIVAVRSWLSTKPSPLPGGRLVEWSSAESTTAPTGEDDPGGEYTVEVHTLSVASGSGALFDVTVELAVSEAGTSVLASPSLVPRAPSAESAAESAQRWPRLETTSATGEVEQAVTAWAEAYTSGDSSALRLAVGDPDSSHSYVPLTGASFTDVDVDDAAPLWGEVDSEDRGRDVTPPRMVVAVEVAVVWDDGDAPDGEQAATLSYDLLVDEADSGSPTVVAWGGAGSGPSLKPYQNAVEGRSLGGDGAASEDPSASPSATPSESGSTQPSPTPKKQNKPGTNKNQKKG